MNLLIPYVPLYDHEDPLLSEFTYGDRDARAKKLKKDLEKRDYVFFHTRIDGRKYITAYYVIDRVLDSTVAGRDRNITGKYKNPHLSPPIYKDNVIIFGDPIRSNRLGKPLLFDRSLAKKLSLGIKFRRGQTESQSIGFATRAWRRLTQEDVQVLLTEAMKERITERPPMKAVLSSDEVRDIVEKDIENIIEKNSQVIGKALRLKNRQFVTPVGRMDLIFEDREGRPVVVELKMHEVGRQAVNQLRRYMVWLRRQTQKEVCGAIVCKGVMPAFQEEFQRLKDIRILRYGWQLKITK